MNFISIILLRFLRHSLLGMMVAAFYFIRGLSLVSFIDGFDRDRLFSSLSKGFRSIFILWLRGFGIIRFTFLICLTSFRGYGGL